MMQSSEFGVRNSELITKHPHSALRQDHPLPYSLSPPRERGRGEGHYRPHSKGFTLLEVMVAVAILGFVLVSLLGLASRSEQDVMMAERITTATLLAKRLMTEALSAKIIVLSEDEGEFEEEDFKDYRWKKIISPTPIAKLMEVRVAVLWKEGQRQEMVELVSYE